MDLRRVLFQLIQILHERAIEAVPRALPENKTTRDSISDIDRYASDLRAVAERLTTAATQMVERIIGLRARRFEEGFIARVKSTIGIDLGTVISSISPQRQTELALATARNANLIKSLSDEAIGRVHREVVNGAIRGDSHVDVQARIREDLRLSQSRARLIARDQSQKLTSDLNQVRQKELGVSKYVWSTSLDERVRDSHAEKEGMTFSWDDPPADTGHPGEDINCRCTAIAVIELE